jgi:UDP-2,4-diacetamido-2,4,6-trideoxy-beta-L-altropyranose hydrolase
MRVRTLLVRADAGVAMGTGHVMRCLALAQAWQDIGGRAVFAMAASTPAVTELLHREKFDVVSLGCSAGSVEEATQTAGVAMQWNSEWVVVDGYQFGAEYQDALKRERYRVLFIDDNGRAGKYSAEIVLDQNPNVDDSAYSDRASNTKLLLGPKYVLLRRDFDGWLKWEPYIPETARRILISMGGSDPDNLTLSAIHVLESADVGDAEITVIVGGSNPHNEALKDAAQRRKPVRFEFDVQGMAEFMSHSDVAMIAAGGTLWEALYMMCPVICYARDRAQYQLIEPLQSEGVLTAVGADDQSRRSAREALRSLLASKAKREEFSKRGREVVDGRGAKRVATILWGNEEAE